MDLHDLSAVETLAQFKSGALSPVEVTRALIARAEAVNPALNALTDTYFDEAETLARQSESRWRDGTARPLEGLPVLIKDNQRIAGRRTTFGSLVHMDSIDQTSDPMPERLLAAGAICLARTTTPEFALLGVTHSRAWGVTRNPFDLTRTPGGSSGGSGAAVAAGIASVATGTDIGGSIRIPAGACGLVGYKPPRGRNPHGYPANLDPFDHCGPITRTVADAALMQNITSGAHPADLYSLRDRMHLTADPAPVKGMRIAFSMDLGFFAIDPDVRANTLAAIETLRDLGCTVEEVDLGWGQWVDTAFLQWFGMLHACRDILPLARDHAVRLTPYAVAYAGIAERATPDDATVALTAVHRMYATFGALLDRFDAFICPTLACPAVPADQDPLTATLIIDGQKVDPENGAVMTWPFNMLGVCPVMSVPSGRSTGGLPTGVQIVGRSYDDATVFRVAAAYAAAVPQRFLTRAVTPTA